MAINPISEWYQLVDAQNTSGISALLAEEVVFYSPVAHTPQLGKAVASKYLTAAFQVFFNDTFHYVREISSSHDAVLEFQVDIDGVTVNGVDLIKWNDEGKITEFKVMLRPLKAINLIHQKMAVMLAKANQ